MVGAVQGEIERHRRPIVLTNRVDLLMGRAAPIFGHRFGGEDFQADILLIELVADVEVEIGTDQPLGKRRFLRHEKPVVALKPPAQADIAQHRVGRHDVERGEPPDAVRPVQRHAKADACTAIVAGDHETAEPEMVHHIERILAHRPERVGTVVIATIGL